MNFIALVIPGKPAAQVFGGAALEVVEGFGCAALLAWGGVLAHDLETRLGVSIDIEALATQKSNQGLSEALCQLDRERRRCANCPR